ncbi:hypothetical protein AVEN_87127-1 [Araneus ventricosus]|uniref:Uncharacterized protein n=1 Tax=Araneus ventricosus TaxID=182803 RepID=A0A4Y2MIV0_ARAVE|nr:hypothetical protein AVEN_58218-1 [Araneus ventricosus]GBN25546.1 hypothetical protein AVEN_87127-1 [Araneus ventricosus]
MIKKARRNTIINERKEREENEIRKEEIAERRRQDEIEIAERRHQEEIEQRKEEYEERKRKDEVEFELQKICLGAEGRSSNSVANQNVNNTQIKPKLEIHHSMQKFNSDENDISLY